MEFSTCQCLKGFRLWSSVCGCSASVNLLYILLAIWVIHFTNHYGDCPGTRGTRADFSKAQEKDEDMGRGSAVGAGEGFVNRGGLVGSSKYKLPSATRPQVPVRCHLPGSGTPEKAKVPSQAF